MKILLLLVLFLWYEQAFSVEMECGKTQFHMDNDLVYDCFADLQNNTIGFFLEIIWGLESFTGMTIMVSFVIIRHIVGIALHIMSV